MFLLFISLSLQSRRCQWQNSNNVICKSEPLFTISAAFKYFLPAWHFCTLLYISACILRPHFASPRVSGSVHTQSILCNNNANTSNSYNKGNNNWRNKRYKCQLQQYAVVVLILKNKCALSLLKKLCIYTMLVLPVIKNFQAQPSSLLKSLMFIKM